MLLTPPELRCAACASAVFDPPKRMLFVVAMSFDAASFAASASPSPGPSRIFIFWTLNGTSPTFWRLRREPAPVDQVVRRCAHPELRGLDFLRRALRRVFPRLQELRSILDARPAERVDARLERLWNGHV